MVKLYCDVGRAIVERLKGATRGKAVVARLACDLQATYPGIGGFSAASLWRMRLFYECYNKNTKLAPLVRDIGWSHNIVIMEKCKEDLQREFYIKMTRKCGWTKNVLINQIENQTYEKTLLNQTNFENTLPDDIRNRAKLAIKDEYMFDLLELSTEHSEKELEQAISS